MQFHPDRNPDNPRSRGKFKELSEAYDVCATTKSARPTTSSGTRLSRTAAWAAAAARVRATSPQASPTSLKTCSATSAVVGGRATGADPRRRHALQHGDHAGRGLSRQERRRSACRPRSACDACHGSGSEGDAAPTTCGMCRGHGKVRAQQGFFTIERTCPTCQGMGHVIENPCRPCGRIGPRPPRKIAWL